MIKGKRLVAWFLTVLMVMQMMPMNVLAEAANEWRLSTYSVTEGGNTYFVVNFINPDGTVAQSDLVAQGATVTPPDGDFWDPKDYQNITADTTVYPKEETSVAGTANVGVYLNNQFVRVRGATITTHRLKVRTVDGSEVRNFSYAGYSFNKTTFPRQMLGAMAQIRKVFLIYFRNRSFIVVGK